MIRPTKTSSIVTVNNHRSTLTRLAIKFYLTTWRGGREILDSEFLRADWQVWFGGWDSVVSRQSSVIVGSRSPKISPSVILSAARRQPSGVEGPHRRKGRDHGRDHFLHGPEYRFKRQ